MTQRQISNWCFSVSIGLYIFACFSTVYRLENGDESIGFMVLIIGFLGLILGYLSWLANPLIFLSWFFFEKNPKWTLILSILSTILTLSFLDTKELLINENSAPVKIIYRGLGYWAWFLSSISIVIGSILYQYFAKDRP